MLVKITGKSKVGFWYNVGEIHNVLPRPFTNRSPWGDTLRYVVKQDVFGPMKGYKSIDVNDCEVIDWTPSKES